MGYRLSEAFANCVVQRFDYKTRRSLTLDNFIHACVTVKTITDSFSAKDTERRGVITIQYEELLTMVMGSKV